MRTGKSLVGNAHLQEVAYIHEPYWRPDQETWIKTLLLFFEGIALLTPGYMLQQVCERDTYLTQPLIEQNLLHIFRSEDLVDPSVGHELTDQIIDLIRAGAFDGLDRNLPYYEISCFRLAINYSHFLHQTLTRLRLAVPSDNDLSLLVHMTVREIILCILPQLIRPSAEELGFSLQPVSQGSYRAKEFCDFLNLEFMPTAGNVIDCDLEQVTLNLAEVPLDEVLDFRRQHGAAHRAYARQLREFVRELALLDRRQREEALADRREEIEDAGSDLRRLADSAWTRPMAAFGLGIAGSAVTLSYGNPVGAVITLAAAVLGLKRQADPANPYMYLVSTSSQLSRGFRS